jgi:CPA2 family monovalent cation:H+ antiporter-2
MGQAVLAVAIILVVGRLVIRPLFRLVGSDASREMFIAFVLLVIIGTALATEEVGLSMALGAFLAGLLFSETEYRHEIEVDIEPFKGLLLGLFFASVGMMIDLAEVADKLLWLIASMVGLYIVKGAIIYVLARLFGDPRSVALEVSLLLGQGGEFAFLIIGLAFSLALIPNDVAQFMLIVTSLTMLATPMVAQGARELANMIQARESARGQNDSDLPTDLTDHTIIVGYGRVGQTISALLDAQELPHVGIDFDGELVSRFRDRGAAVFYGDASRPEMLRRFGADRARALVVTIDKPAAAGHVVAAARQHWPQLAIYARARDAEHAAQLIARGASHVVPEILEVSLELGEMLLVNSGVPEQAARRMVETRRRGEQTTIDKGFGQKAG